MSKTIKYCYPSLAIWFFQQYSDHNLLFDCLLRLWISKLRLLLSVLLRRKKIRVSCVLSQRFIFIRSTKTWHPPSVRRRHIPILRISHFSVLWTSSVRLNWGTSKNSTPCLDCHTYGMRTNVKGYAAWISRGRRLGRNGIKTDEFCDGLERRDHISLSPERSVLFDDCSTAVHQGRLCMDIYSLAWIMMWWFRGRWSVWFFSRFFYLVFSLACIFSVYS